MTMAEAQVDSSTDSTLQRGPYKIVNNQFLIINNRSRGLKKRKRLNQVVDKLNTQVTDAELALFNNFKHYNNNNKFISNDYDVENETRAVAKASKCMLNGVQQQTKTLEESRKEMAPLIGQVFFDGSDQERLTRISPVSPMAAEVYNFEHFLQTKYFPEFFRRCGNANLWPEPAQTDRDCIEKRQNGRRPRSKAQMQKQPIKTELLPQESPLDLSTKGAKTPRAELMPNSFEKLLNLPDINVIPSQFLPRKGTFSVPVVKGDVASHTTNESVAVRYNLEVSPVVEEMPPGSDVAYVCPVCGQMFSLHDRLAKHIASRHKNRTKSSDSTKAYLCEVCNRSFARSDMLTRHMRLHTGIKPYTCKVCGQVFSRSDHLSTHQRTHTGEKPYKCPQCPYAACRRDMITRHMRTHTRYDPNIIASENAESTVPDSPQSSSSRVQSPSTSSPVEITTSEQDSKIMDS